MCRNCICREKPLQEPILARYMAQNGSWSDSSAKAPVQKIVIGKIDVYVNVKYALSSAPPRF